MVAPTKRYAIPRRENSSSNNNNQNKKNSGDINDKDIQKENKPVIDYHYKLKNLETEIGHSYQKYNTIILISNSFPVTIR